jgi:hypothetical protein
MRRSSWVLTADLRGKSQVLADSTEVAVGTDVEVAIATPTEISSQHMSYTDGRWSLSSLLQVALLDLSTFLRDIQARGNRSAGSMNSNA